MHSLLLLLKGPMQSWGDESRFNTRATATTPTKSGIVGLIAAAQGRLRVEPIGDLAQLRMAVRVDQPGSLLRDYQTAQPWVTAPKADAILSTRYFLADAVFVVAVESESRDLLESIAESLRNPVFPLYMGRRSCPVHPGLVIGVVGGDSESALREYSTWNATQRHKRESPKSVELALYRDANPGEQGVVLRRDVPVSFSSEHRQYSWRHVSRVDDVVMDNQEGAGHLAVDDVFFKTVMYA